jgi:hypothetical protein
MAALSNLNPTLKDLAAVTGPDGQISQIVEILSQDCEMLDDMAWVEGNLPTGNRSTIRTGLPIATWRKLYGGIQPSKSTTTGVTDTCGMLHALSEIDCALLDMANSPQQFLLQESSAFIQAMSQEMQRVAMYGNEGTQPEAFTGLAPRYNSLAAPNAYNIIDAGGTGTDNASIWLVYWHPMQVAGIIPKGSIAGLQIEDFGRQWVENIDGANGRMLAYRTSFRWDAGLMVRDWRSIVRICNIDKSDLVSTGVSGAALPDLMFQALELVPRGAAMGRPAFYMNQKAMSMLRRQIAARTANSSLVVEDVGGRKIHTFQGVPLRRVDALAADEARVV